MLRVMTTRVAPQGNLVEIFAEFAINAWLSDSRITERAAQLGFPGIFMQRGNMKPSSVYEATDRWSMSPKYYLSTLIFFTDSLLSTTSLVCWCSESHPLR